MEFFATCPKGFETVLGDELRTAGIKRVRPLSAGVSFMGEPQDAYRALLWSRVASRVLLTLGRVQASDADILYEQVKALEWEACIGGSSTIAVDARGTNNKLRNTQFLALRVKDALCDRLVGVRGQRPDVDVKNPDLRINVNLRHEKATVSLDLSGRSLDKRGYQMPGKPPAVQVRENLAAAALLLAGWDKAVQHGGASLVDPLCADGAFAVEAALIAHDIAPGIQRSAWGFDAWEAHDESAWSALLDEADERAQAGELRHVPIYACSASEAELSYARERAKRAGAAKHIRFMQADATHWAELVEQVVRAGLTGQAGHAGRAVRVENVERTERVGQAGHAGRAGHGGHAGPFEASDGARSFGSPGGARGAEGVADGDGISAAGSALADVAAQAGGMFAATYVPAGMDTGTHGPYSLSPLFAQAQQAGVSTFVLVADEQAPALPDMQPHVDISANNKGQDCSVRVFDLSSADLLARENVSVRGTDIPVFDARAQQFASRLNKVAKQRRKWAAKHNVDAYRVYDADLPDYNMAIDLYQGAGACEGERMVYVAEYAAPKEIDPAKATQRIMDALAIIPTVLEVDPSHVFLKQRVRSKGGSQYAAPSSKTGARASGSAFVTRENGLLFEVNLQDYLDTGLFLDHRGTRALIRTLAKDKVFLNLFAYTGTASVYAAAGGAKYTTTVDLSNTYLEWARRNMELNGLLNERQEFERADCIAWVQEKRRTKERWDFIFCDPPTYSNSAKMGKRTWDVQRDHAELLIGASRLLRRGGAILFSCNLRSFKPDVEKITKTGIQMVDISAKTIPEDFERHQKIHHCYLLRRL